MHPKLWVYPWRLLSLLKEKLRAQRKSQRLPTRASKGKQECTDGKDSVLVDTDPEDEGDKTKVTSSKKKKGSPKMVKGATKPNMEVDEEGKGKKETESVEENMDVDSPKAPKKGLKIHIKLPTKTPKSKGGADTEGKQAAKRLFKDDDQEEPKPGLPPNKRQQHLLQERAERARKLEEQQSRIEDNKRVQHDWREESKEWRTNADGMLAGQSKWPWDQIRRYWRN
jgi:hypothetical protein